MLGILCTCEQHSKYLLLLTPGVGLQPPIPISIHS